MSSALGSRLVLIPFTCISTVNQYKPNPLPPITPMPARHEYCTGADFLRTFSHPFDIQNVCISDDQVKFVVDPSSKMEKLYSRYSLETECTTWSSISYCLRHAFTFCILSTAVRELSPDTCGTELFFSPKGACSFLQG